MNRKPVIGIYLAAGKSSRMGKNKLHLPFEGMKLGNHALLTALHSSIDHILVVTKEDDSLSWIDSAVRNYEKKWTRIRCAEAADGQAYSIKCGLEKAITFSSSAVVILLADQPLLRLEMIENVIKFHKENPNIGYIASGFAGRTQPPILFSEPLFPMLQKLEGDKGARAVLRQQSAASGKTITYTDGRGFYDIDTEEDYKWIMKQMEQ